MRLPIQVVLLVPSLGASVDEFITSNFEQIGLEPPSRDDTVVICFAGLRETDAKAFIKGAEKLGFGAVSWAEYQADDPRDAQYHGWMSFGKEELLLAMADHAKKFGLERVSYAEVDTTVH